MQKSYTADAVVDLSASSDTSAATVDMPGAGVLYVDQIFGRFEEAVASGGFTSAAGVASVEVAGTEVCTWSTGVTSTARAIGDTVFVTPSAAVTANGGIATFAAGDAIEVVTKTAGTGGTVTGTIRFNLPVEFNAG